MIKSAVISKCGQYRYHLARGSNDPKKRMLFVMLNPSTADANVDDPTIRRCMGFARREGFEGVTVVNLYGFRATKPADLWKARDPVGPDNWDWVAFAGANSPGFAVVAWGSKIKWDVTGVIHTLELGDPAFRFLCLGKTKNGHPKHPLYLRSDAPLIPWSLGDLR